MSGAGPDPAAVFRQEAQELLAQLEATLLELERRPGDVELANTAFRALHTLKGSGAMFGPPPLARFAHAVETAFEQVRTGERRPDGAFVGLMLRAADRLRQLAERPEDDDPAATRRLVEELEAAWPGPAIPAAAEEPAAGAGQRAYRIRVKLAENALVFGANPLALLDELRTLGPCEVRADLSALPELERLNPSVLYFAWGVLLRTTEPSRAIDDVFLFVADDEDIQVEEVGEEREKEEAPAAGDESQGRGAEIVPLRPAPAWSSPAAPADVTAGEPRRAAAVAAEAAGSVRVPAARLDLLMDQVGELVIAQARLSALAYGRRDPALSSAAEEIERLAAEMRDSAMAMRMLPVGTLFGRFRRVVRDLSEELGKSIDLVTSGEDTELDKRVVERLGDPLIHMIRNSIDWPAPTGWSGVNVSA